MFRQGLHFTPLRALDSLGGLVLGAATGLAIVWVLGAAALLLPGQRELRRNAQDSEILRRLNEIVPPATLLHALARVDPFPAIAGPAAPSEAPDPSVLRFPGVRASSPSVVRVHGTACGLGIAGSGWAVAPGLVVTAAHVVAGETDTTVQQPSSAQALPAQAVAFDAKNDIAVLRVPSLGARPLPMATPERGAAVAIVGYPGDGPLTATPSRIGTTATILASDAYGNRPVTRTVTSVGGSVRHGDSGAPAIDTRGQVQATIFAARVGAPGGYGVPSDLVREIVATSGRSPVSTGSCAP
jgi:S1-C subfamily serine protease